MSTKYLKKKEGEASNIAHRVDNEPVFNEVSTTTEYRINGDWYDATGTKLPPQSYVENPDGTLVEFEVQDGKVVDKHSGEYVPSINENAINVKSLTVTDVFDLGQKYYYDLTNAGVDENGNGRTSDVVNTNITGKSIIVILHIYQSNFNFMLDGEVLFTANMAASTQDVFSVIVPNNSSYKVFSNGALNITKWSELR